MEYNLMELVIWSNKALQTYLHQTPQVIVKRKSRRSPDKLLSPNSKLLTPNSWLPVWTGVTLKCKGPPPHPPTHPPKLLSTFTTKCYTFLDTSHGPRLKSQLSGKNFANFFATLFCKFLILFCKRKKVKRLKKEIKSSPMSFRLTPSTPV